MTRTPPPLTEEQRRVAAAAWIAYPNGIHPDDAEMRDVCVGLVERGTLEAVAAEEAKKLTVAYVASPTLRTSIEQRTRQN